MIELQRLAQPMLIGQIDFDVVYVQVAARERDDPVARDLVQRLQAEGDTSALNEIAKPIVIYPVLDVSVDARGLHTIPVQGDAILAARVGFGSLCKELFAQCRIGGRVP